MHPSTWWRCVCRVKQQGNDTADPFIVLVSSWGRRDPGVCTEEGWPSPWGTYPAMDSTSCLTRSLEGLWLKPTKSQVSFGDNRTDHHWCSTPEVPYHSMGTWQNKWHNTLLCHLLSLFETSSSTNLRQHAPLCKIATPVYYHIRIRNEYTHLYCRPIRTGTGRKMSSVGTKGVSVVTLVDTHR